MQAERPSMAAAAAPPVATTIVTVTAIVAAAVWMGGLVALGAVVAPIVFRTVPAPTSADAMTLVFRRFDKVALACAAVLLVSEAVRAALRAPIGRLGVLRMGLGAVATAFVVWEASSLSPRIEALHRAGAVRGLGDAGLELEAVHKLAEAAGKGQVYALLGVLVLYAIAAAPSRRDGRRTVVASSTL